MRGEGWCGGWWKRGALPAIFGTWDYRSDNSCTLMLLILPQELHVNLVLFWCDYLRTAVPSDMLHQACVNFK